MKELVKDCLCLVGIAVWMMGMFVLLLGLTR